ncbi:MAG: hypothetical protein IPP80_14445 [Ignavibacteria bacterium]|nr:hypothetical protein [Ignavibacteria bacterium]
MRRTERPGKAATEALSAGLAEEAKTHAFVFNTVIADCETNQRLRGFPSWISSRNLENEVSDESVQTLINAVVDRYDLVRRYYSVKQRLLGLDEFHDYDRKCCSGIRDNNVDVGSSERSCDRCLFKL